MSQIQSSSCANCFHAKENHTSGVCSGSLTCMCEKYIEPFLFAFAHRVEQEKHERKSIKKRCEYILEHIPKTRNAGEKTFYKIYIEIWHGFKIRKQNTSLTMEEWKRLPNQDTINREKRRCKQLNEELKTYSPQIKYEQAAIYQALLEMAIDE